MATIDVYVTHFTVCIYALCAFSSVFFAEFCSLLVCRDVHYLLFPPECNNTATCGSYGTDMLHRIRVLPPQLDDETDAVTVEAKLVSELFVARSLHHVAYRRPAVDAW